MKAGASIAVILATWVAGACANAATPSLDDVITATQPIIDLRLRTESVSQSGIARDASAFTLRGRLGFETGKIWSTQLLAEAELVWPLGENYNSTVNGKTQFPVVADPEDYDLNRLQLANTSIPDTTVVIGRQRITLDDHRFVGNVGWRQNEQTFDAIRVTNRSIKNLAIDVAYVDQVNRVFGRESAVGRYRGSTWFANAAYQTPYGKLTGFAYVLDLDLAPTDSSSTIGVRFTGEHAMGAVKLGYLASFAAQDEYADNPLNYRDDYYALELAATVHDVSFTAGVELLEGNGVKGFTAPLGTLHRFQGWADKFLTTPANGIDDRYLGVGYSRKKTGPLDAVSATVSYHWFESDRLGLNYGSELDLQLQLKLRRYTLLAKYADYSADTFATDTRKVWFQLEYQR
jgi:hypothetical protein